MFSQLLGSTPMQPPWKLCTPPARWKLICPWLYCVYSYIVYLYWVEKFWSKTFCRCLRLYVLGMLGMRSFQYLYTNIYQMNIISVLVLTFWPLVYLKIHLGIVVKQNWWCGCIVSFVYRKSLGHFKLWYTSIIYTDVLYWCIDILYWCIDIDTDVLILD